MKFTILYAVFAIFILLCNSVPVPAKNPYEASKVLELETNATLESNSKVYNKSRPKEDMNVFGGIGVWGVCNWC